MYGIVQDFGRGALGEEALIGPRALSGVRPSASSYVKLMALFMVV